MASNVTAQYFFNRLGVSILPYKRDPQQLALPGEFNKKIEWTRVEPEPDHRANGLAEFRITKRYSVEILSLLKEYSCISRAQNKIKKKEKEKKKIGGADYVVQCIKYM